MIKIEIKVASFNVRTNSGGTFHEQEAWAYLTDRDGNPHPYPQLIRINLDVKGNQPPYPVGVYQIEPSSVYVNKYGGLNFGQIRLRPLSVASPKAVA